MVKIPLRNRTGDITAWATIDDIDAEWVNQFRWSLNGNGYAWRSIHGGRRHVYLHRAIASAEVGQQVDHINRERLDNRRANLRIATSAQNRQNTPALGGSSTYRGVSWDRARGKWHSYAQLGGRCHYLGRFDAETEAASVASNWRRANMPFSEEDPA